MDQIIEKIHKHYRRRHALVILFLVFSLAFNAIAPAGMLWAQDDGQQPQDGTPGENVDDTQDTFDPETIIDTGDSDTDVDVDNDVNTNTLVIEDPTSTPTSTEPLLLTQDASTTPTSTEPIVDEQSSTTPTSTQTLVVDDQEEEGEVVVDAEAPSLPANVQADAVSYDQIDLTWEAATDNVGVAGYYLYRGISTIPLAVVPAGVLEYVDDDVEPETEYVYGVSAFDATGNEGARSLPASATTLEAPEVEVTSTPEALQVQVDEQENDNSDQCESEPENQDEPSLLGLLQSNAQEAPTTTSDLFDDQASTDTNQTTEPVLHVTNTNNGTVGTGVCANGSTGENEADGGEGDVLVHTGDANVDVDVNNTVNTNSTDPNQDSLANTCQSPDGSCGDIGENNLDVQNTNNATTTTAIDANGNSGDNTVTDAGDDVVVQTGDVDVDVNVSNVINTSITGTGTAVVVDITDPAQGDLDLSGNKNTSGNKSVLDQEGVEAKSVETNNVSNASVSNNINVSANSGGNTVSGSGGDTVISTGDVNVEVNVSNVVNTNITGSDWLYTVVNIFDEWQGNLILPTMHGGDPQAGERIAVNATASNINAAGIVNDVNVNGNSGNNAANGGNGSTVATGNVEASANVLNVVNSNIFGSNWDFVKINLFEGWQGEIFGLPANAEYYETADGIIIWNGDKHDNPIVVDDGNGYQLSDGSGLVVRNENSAEVVNNISVDANSGENTAEGDDELILLTGAVKAKVNVSNLVNTNLIGDDWVYSLINVFGNWLGNLEFGKPDLWITETKKTTGSPAAVGDFVTYTFDFGNRGNTPAEHVKIFDSFSDDILYVVDAAGGSVVNDGVLWDIGRLEPGETRSITYVSTIRNDLLPQAEYKVQNVVTIFSQQTEEEGSDNSDSGAFHATLGGATQPDDLTIAFNSYNTDMPDAGVSGWQNVEWGLEKTHNAEAAVSAGHTVTYTITLQNLGDFSAYDAILEDILLDGEGNVVASNQWPLGEVYEHEEITVTYDVEITDVAPAGTYVNTARIEGWDDKRGRWIIGSASTELEVIKKGADEQEEVGQLSEGQNDEQQEENPITANPASVLDYIDNLVSGGALRGSGVVLGESITETAHIQRTGRQESNNSNSEDEDDTASVAGAASDSNGKGPGIPPSYFAANDQRADATNDLPSMFSLLLMIVVLMGMYLYLGIRKTFI